MITVHAADESRVTISPCSGMRSGCDRSRVPPGVRSRCARVKVCVVLRFVCSSNSVVLRVVPECW